MTRGTMFLLPDSVAGAKQDVNTIMATSFALKFLTKQFIDVDLILNKSIYPVAVGGGALDGGIFFQTVFETGRKHFFLEVGKVF